MVSGRSWCGLSLHADGSCLPPSLTSLWYYLWYSVCCGRFSGGARMLEYRPIKLFGTFSLLSRLMSHTACDISLLFWALGVQLQWEMPLTQVFVEPEKFTGSGLQRGRGLKVQSGPLLCSNYGSLQTQPNPHCVAHHSRHQTGFIPSFFPLLLSSSLAPKAAPSI